MSKKEPSEKIKNRNLYLPEYVWDAVDEDAKRCGRSAIKQVMALLIAYYDLGNIELSIEGLERMRLASIPLGRTEAKKTPPHTMPKSSDPTGPIRSTAFIPTKKKGGKG